MSKTVKQCPIKNKKLFLILSISVAVLIVIVDLILFSTSLQKTGVGCGFSRFWKDSNISIGNNNNNDMNTPLVSKKDNFSLTSTYIGNNNWEYTVTGQLPTPCHKADVQSLVAESYPEQVFIVITVKEPQPDIICTQVIQEFEYEGTFTASENATVSLDVR